MNKRVVLLANDTTYTYNLRLALIKELINQKYEIYIVAEILKFKDELESIGCHLINIDIGRHGTNPLSDFKLMKQYKKILKHIKPEYVLSYNIKPNVYGGMACKSIKTKFMPNITGLGTALEYPGIMQKITITLNKIGLKNASVVFFQNSENMEFFEKNKILSKKTKMVLLPGSGVDLEKHELIDYPNDNIIKFLYIARIMKDKGIDIYLDVAKEIRKKYPNTEFHICGYCDDDKYKDILNQYEKDNVIIYHGEQKNMIPFFKMASCIIHPSYYPEGMSNVLLEAAAHGRPIICTDRSGCRETVNDGESGFIVPIKNTNKVIESVEKIIKMTYKERKQMGISGRKKIEKEFDRDIVVKKYLKEVNDIQKKYIYYIGGFELPDKNAAAQRVIGNSKIFKNLGYEMLYSGITKAETSDEIQNSYPVTYPNNIFQMFKFITSIKFYKSIISNIDGIKMVVLYNCPAVVSYRLLKYCKRKNIKCIGDITEWYHIKTNNIIFNFIKNMDSELRMRCINKKLDGLIVISAFLKDYYKRCKNVIMIPPLIDIEDKKWKLKGTKDNENTIKFLYFGSPGVDRKDRIDVIIDILQNCKFDYIFNIVGIDNEQFKKIYRNVELKSEKIVFHGRVSHINALSFLKDSDALIFYRDDSIVSKAGFSTKFVESISYKVPVITNMTSNLSDYIKDDINGLVLNEKKNENITKLEGITKEKILELKNNIDNSLFDYRKYIDNLNSWINKISD